MKRFRRTPEIKVKCVVEPVVVFLAGSVLLGFSPPLGGYLMIASAVLVISTSLAENHDRKRIRDLNDAYLEQQRVAERFRDLNGNG